MEKIHCSQDRKEVMLYWLCFGHSYGMENTCKIGTEVVVFWWPQLNVLISWQADREEREVGLVMKTDDEAVQPDEDQSELAEKGRALIADTSTRYLRASLPKLPSEGVK